jgi:Endoplasmic reticulum protein ERp29, C-terminal domain
LFKLRKLAGYYAKTMEKTLANPGFPKKEISRLGKIMATGTTTALKQDEMVIKTNILKVFGDEEHDEL